MRTKVVKVPLTRVNTHLPMPLYERVKEYATELGIPITQTIILLLNQGLEYHDNLKMLSSLTTVVSDLKAKIPTE